MTFDPYSSKDFLKAHKLMTSGLIDESGLFRSGDVGVFDGRKIVHMGARPDFVPELISDLLTWAKETDLHPLVKSSVMHYEIETIHPFADGNGRMGRLWQTLLISKWKEIFAWIPMESVIYEKRQEYYDAIEIARNTNDSAKFIEYTLAALYESVLDQIDLQENTTSNTAPSDVVNDVLNKTEAAVLKLISESSRITIVEIAANIEKSKSTVDRAIKALKNKNLIERKDSDKAGYWEIVGSTKNNS